ncbi:hypothetical protein C9J85_12300 [Haloferax sp. wsp5]|nr:hypothetical protein C9J85_12300 [Haloferax sp. wsp5]
MTVRGSGLRRHGARSLENRRNRPPSRLLPLRFSARFARRRRNVTAFRSVFDNPFRVPHYHGMVPQIAVRTA